tara:strand:- start:132 stop:878 length:747 start_codon:yes stop_codon:yes gene_type:complete
MRRNNRFITTSVTKKGEVGFDELVSIVLFGENHGYRMKSYGPIPLMKIEGRTLIQRQVETIKAAFKKFEIILCSGFETQRTVEFVKENFPDINIRVVENQIHFNSNCCESARLCLNNINNDKILFCNGALLISPENLLNVNFSKSCIISQTSDEFKSFDIGVIEDDSRLQSLSIGVKTDAWTEMLYLSDKKAVNSLYKIVSNPEYKNKFLFEAVNDLLKNNTILAKKNPSNPIIKIHNIKTLRRITKI